MPKIKLLFAWYDLWIGFYWDRVSKKLYFLPIPCFGIILDFSKPTQKPIIIGFEKREDPNRG
jgi:hypothetical protein